MKLIHNCHLSSIITSASLLRYARLLPGFTAHAFIVLVLLNSIAVGQQLLQTYDDPTVTQRDFFGRSFAVFGDQVLIGADGDDSAGSEVGQAHLFDLATNDLVFTLSGEDTTSAFGYGVDLNAEYAVIGAPNDSTAGFSRSGRVFLHDAQTGDLLRTFNNPSPGQLAEFGIGVILTSEGLLVAAPGSNSGRGKAYLIDIGTGNMVRSFEPPPNQGARFGAQASMATYGNLALFGDYADDKAYLFDLSNSQLLHTFDDPGAGDRDWFGRSVAINQEHIVIGAQFDDTVHGRDVGRAYLYDTATRDLLAIFDDPTPTQNDSFGFAVALSDDVAVVGAPGDETQGTDVGQTHIFDVETGILLATIDDPTNTLGVFEGFGSYFAIDSDRLYVGSPGDNTFGFDVGQVNVFSIPEPSPLSCFGLGFIATLILRRN